MSTTQTLARLKDLKLGGMAAALEHQQNQLGTYDELPFADCPELNRPLEQFFENKISIKAGQIHSFEKPEATNDYRALLAGVIKHKTVTRGEEASNVG